MQKQKGQVFLIVILVMVIALTVGLSLVSRSVITVKTTSEEADSQKAFNAAEAGVEIALQKSQSTTDVTIGQKTLANNAVIQQVLIHPITGSSIVLNDGNPVSQDQGIDIWLTTYPDYSGNPWTGKMYVYWGSKNGCNDAAIEAIIISGTSSTDKNAKIERYGIDPCGTNSVDPSKNRTGQNKFSPASGSGSVNGTRFNFSTSIPIINGLLVRVIPLYANTPLGIVGYDNSSPQALQNFPSQGRIITSTGVFGTTQRKVSFFQGYPLLPSEFFYSFFQSQ